MLFSQFCAGFFIKSVSTIVVSKKNEYYSKQLVIIADMRLLVKCYDNKWLSHQGNPLQGCLHVANQQKEKIIIVKFFTKYQKIGTLGPYLRNSYCNNTHLILGGEPKSK